MDSPKTECLPQLIAGKGIKYITECCMVYHIYAGSKPQLVNIIWGQSHTVAGAFIKYTWSGYAVTVTQGRHHKQYVTMIIKPELHAQT